VNWMVPLIFYRTSHSNLYLLWNTVMTDSISWNKNWMTFLTTIYVLSTEDAVHFSWSFNLYVVCFFLSLNILWQVCRINQVALHSDCSRAASWPHVTATQRLVYCSTLFDSVQGPILYFSLESESLQTACSIS
jgi:hypothetical protein